MRSQRVVVAGAVLAAVVAGLLMPRPSSHERSDHMVSDRSNCITQVTGAPVSCSQALTTGLAGLRITSAFPALDVDVRPATPR